MAEEKKGAATAAPREVMCIATKMFYDEKGRTITKGQRYPYTLQPGEELPNCLVEEAKPKAEPKE